MRVVGVLEFLVGAGCLGTIVWIATEHVFDNNYERPAREIKIAEVTPENPRYGGGLYDEMLPPIIRDSIQGELAFVYRDR